MAVRPRVIRAVVIAALAGALGCGDDDATTGPLDAGTRDAGGAASDAGEVAADAHTATDAGGAAGSDAGTDPDAPGPRVTTFTDSPPITATTGQVISGARIASTAGPCITIDVPGVVVRDSDIGPCGGEANVEISAGGTDALVEHCLVHDGNRGVLAQNTSGVVVRASRFDTFAGPAPLGTAIEYDYLASGTIERNEVRGAAYASDAVSVFESSFVRIVGNDIDVDVAEASAAAFTLGDALPGHEPGHDNYATRNVVHQLGGVPPGVFGSTGNTVLERNCLTSGVQAYAYNDNPFVGVAVRLNVIDLGASFVRDPAAVAGWDTNVDGTDCTLVPGP